MTSAKARKKLDPISLAFLVHRESCDALERSILITTRERIADLERDLSHALAELAKLAVAQLDVVVEEQGPWVLQNRDGGMYGAAYGRWSDDPTLLAAYVNKSDANAECKNWYAESRVITLAEAIRISGQK